jgi:hypothetical protein
MATKEWNSDAWLWQVAEETQLPYPQELKSAKTFVPFAAFCSTRLLNFCRAGWLGDPALPIRRR